MKPQKKGFNLLLCWSFSVDRDSHFNFEATSGRHRSSHTPASSELIDEILLSIGQI